MSDEKRLIELEDMHGRCSLSTRAWAAQALRDKDAEIERLTITTDEQHTTLRLIAKDYDKAKAKIERLQHQRQLTMNEGNEPSDGF